MLDTSKIYTSKNCGELKVTKYKNSMNVEVEFLLTGFYCTTQSIHILNGDVKDPFFPRICGVGYIGSGSYLSGINGVMGKCYTVWRDMLRRCYDEETQIKQPSYAGITVCKEWHNYQNFAEWFQLNYIKGYHLDKDIRQKGVSLKAYSPESCQFIPQRENNEDAHAKHFTFKNPCGKVVEVYNLTKFCKENNLTRANMDKVDKYKRPHHKGWTKA